MAKSVCSIAPWQVLFHHRRGILNLGPNQRILIVNYLKLSRIKTFGLLLGEDDG